MKQQASLHESDGFSVMSIVLGLIGALLTALIHLQIATSSHFDFLARDPEFFLVLGFVTLIIALCFGDFKAAFYTLRHLNEPHASYTKSAAMVGIGLGMVDLLPALILLAIIIETSFLAFMGLNFPIN